MLQQKNPETSLVVQWLKLCASTVGNVGLIRKLRFRMPHSVNKKKSFLSKEIKSSICTRPRNLQDQASSYFSDLSSYHILKGQHHHQNTPTTSASWLFLQQPSTLSLQGLYTSAPSTWNILSLISPIESV